MDSNDLWIGEKVRLKKSGRIGKYEGKTEQGKLRISLGYKTVLTTIKNLEIVDYVDLPEVAKPMPVATEDMRFEGSTIDLHMEVLNPSMQHEQPIQIRNYQIRKAKEFIDYGYTKRYVSITIIHGKGEGVLKSEIQHLLSMHDDIRHYHTINNGGATEAYYEY